MVPALFADIGAIWCNFYLRRDSDLNISEMIKKNCKCHKYFNLCLKATLKISLIFVLKTTYFTSGRFGQRSKLIEKKGICLCKKRVQILQGWLRLQHDLETNISLLLWTLRRLVKTSYEICLHWSVAYHYLHPPFPYHDEICLHSTF